MDYNRQQQAQGIYGDVPFAAFDFFARVITPLPPFKVVFTDWESMMATLGFGVLPILKRSSSRNPCKARAQTPANRERRKRA